MHFWILGGIRGWPCGDWLLSPQAGPDRRRQAAALIGQRLALKITLGRSSRKVHQKLEPSSPQGPGQLGNFPQGAENACLTAWLTACVQRDAGRRDTEAPPPLSPTCNVSLPTATTSTPHPCSLQPNQPKPASPGHGVRPFIPPQATRGRALERDQTSHACWPPCQLHNAMRLLSGCSDGEMQRCRGPATRPRQLRD